MALARDQREGSATPRWLYVFCYALMGPACAINAAFIAVTVPAVAPFGLPGLVGASVVGAIIGILPAIWLARRIGEGIKDR